jgi:hypothetical protein
VGSGTTINFYSPKRALNQRYAVGAGKVLPEAVRANA